MKLSPVDFSVFGTRISALTMEKALALVHCFARNEATGCLVAFANVHMVVEATNDSCLHKMLEDTDLICPDGKPIAWIGQALHGRGVSQISGPEFMPLFCEESVAPGYSHFLYGGVPGIAEQASENLGRMFPGIKIVGTYSPPFRIMSTEEDDAVCDMINSSGAQIVWVSLGCPKQEKWMADHRDRLQAKVLLGVGQALDILAGSKERAPTLLRTLGLEWLFRLVREPNRLWKRYLLTNSAFIFLLIRDAFPLRLRRA